MKTLDYSLLTKVFTRSMLVDFSNKQIRNSALLSLAVENFVTDPYSKTYAEIFEELYIVLKKEYRNEYFYKNTLLNKLLLGVHSTNTTTALAELPIGRAKADFLLINGKAVVYEIKTELDNFDRLHDQIENYYKAFDNVAIVSCEKNKEVLLDRYRNTSVGIYIINKSDNISRVQEPKVSRKNLDLSQMFSILRKYEYEKILLKYYSVLPTKESFDYYDDCHRLFCLLDKDNAYKDMLKQLKMRVKISSPIFNEVPKSIKSLGYFEGLSDYQYERLDKNLRKYYGR